MSENRPNVLIFHSHDTGRHVGPYGINTVHTPTFDRVAAEGVVFENAFCTAPQCSPSRSSLFTGLYPHSNGVFGLTHKGSGEMHEHVRHATHYMKDLGYETAAFGVVHECRDRARVAYEVFDGKAQTKPITENFAAWLDGRPSDAKPFFASIGTQATHLPWPNEPDTELGLTIPPWLDDGEKTRDLIARMQADVRELDGALASVIASLEAAGQLDNTLLIVTTDHGLPLVRAKCTLFDSGVGVLMQMRWPGRIYSGKREAGLMSNVDVLPTILEAVGAPADLAGRDAIEGISMWPCLAGESASPRSEVFIEHTIELYYDPARGMRDDRYKYIRYFEHGPGVHIPGDVSSEPYFSEQIGPAQSPLRHFPEELYDLQNDPLEKENLAERDDHRAIVETMRKRVAQHMRETSDPLLDGPIASPYFSDNIAHMRSL